MPVALVAVATLRRVHVSLGGATCLGGAAVTVALETIILGELLLTAGGRNVPSAIRAGVL